MSVDFDPSKQRWRVRWREDGKQRSRRFASEAEAIAFDSQRHASLHAQTTPQPVTGAAGDAIYAYATQAGQRYRFVFRQSDGTLSSRRGVRIRGAAAVARRRLVESIDRGEHTVCRESFASWSEMARSLSGARCPSFRFGRRCGRLGARQLTLALDEHHAPARL